MIKQPRATPPFTKKTQTVVKIAITRVCGITRSAFARHGKDMGSRLGFGTVAVRVYYVATARPGCSCSASKNRTKPRHR